MKQDTTSTRVRETLFGDMPPDRFPPGSAASDEPPWATFDSARKYLKAGDQSAAAAAWRSIIEQPDLESRHKLQAWHFLRQLGEHPPPETAKQVLGVVVEVMLPEGLDLLAAYSDHSARYYNYSGAAVIWERPDEFLDRLIEQLLAASAEVVGHIGPWDDSRPPAPAPGHARMSFLTPSGLHFGEGPMSALSADALGGPVIHLALGLMKALLTKANYGA